MVLVLDGHLESTAEQTLYLASHSVLLFRSSACCHHELAAVDHVASGFPAGLDQDELFYDIDCMLCVFEVGRPHMLTHSREEVSRLDLLRKSVSIEDDVLHSVNFQVEF